MRIVILLLPVLALLGGAGAAWLLRPQDAALAEAAPAPPPEGPSQLLTLREMFVVPVLRDGRSWGHVVLELGVESPRLTNEDILRREPLLRDGLNEALFVHASLGGFDGTFTAIEPLNRLRLRLNEVVTARLGDPDARVLITSIVRQDG
jgi:hypothetical protein